tara:strand:- start:786 stop:3530 length:2745 start_codon:yes stop_codon:yes gene_type:complete
MSVQLIVYPQNFNGQFNAISTVANEKVVDGINFSTINTSASADISSFNASTPITAAPPTIMNTWYRSRSTSSGTPALPASSGGDLYLYSVVGNTTSSVYQRLSNLTVGNTYTFIAQIDNTATGQAYLRVYNGSTSTIIGSQVQTITALSAGFISVFFTAQTTEDIIQIAYNNSIVGTFKITNMSVTPVSQGTLSLTEFELANGQVICDLYQEEDIPLTLSVDDFKNVAEKVQSYSKDFDLPATKRNNQIFDSIFEITRSDNGIMFNPYIKTQCVLKQDGYILFEGYLRLIDVKDQEGEISYNVNLYSEVVALADVLKDRTFSDLDFTELEHAYNKTNIKYSWNDSGGTGITYTNSSTSGYRDANNTVKYPFVDWSHQILIANGATGNNATEDYPELTSLQQAFRPFINIKYLINRIFQATPFTWSSNFFDTTEFDKLFMDFNWGSGNEIIEGTGSFGETGSNTSTSSFTNLELDTTSFPDAFGWDSGNFRFVAAENNTGYMIEYHYEIQMLATDVLTVRWVHLNSAGTVLNVIDYEAASQSSGNIVLWTGTLFANLNQNDTLQAQFKTASSGNAKQRDTLNLPWSTVTASVGLLTATGNTLLQTLRGEVGQWDFLKGIMTMFNLVSLPDANNPLNITFEPYNDVFISDTKSSTLSDLTLATRSIEHDWTEKVDVSEMKLTPLTDLNKNTVFKFVEDDDDYAFNLYKKSVGGYLYGSKVYDASAFTILDGEDEIIAEPFAATVPKPLAPQFSDFIVPAIFTSNDEATEFEGFDNSPRIMYNNGVKVLDGGVTYYIPEQNGVASENQANFLQFSHLTDIPTVAATTSDFNFGECQLIEPIGVSVPRNLFNIYWLPYYSELYNPDTRIMTLKVNLTPSDINTFQFYDSVMIKNRVFRVNKIEYKPNDLATVEFILIP